MSNTQTEVNFSKDPTRVVILPNNPLDCNTLVHPIITMLCWNQALPLDFASHVTSLNLLSALFMALAAALTVCSTDPKIHFPLMQNLAQSVSRYTIILYSQYWSDVFGLTHTY